MGDALLATTPAYAPAVLRCGMVQYIKAKTECLSQRKSYRLYAVLDGIATLLEGEGREEFRSSEVLLLPPGGDRSVNFGAHFRALHLVFDVVAAPRHRSERGDWRHLPGTRQQPAPLAVWGVDLPRRVPHICCRSGLDMLYLARAISWRGVIGATRANGHLAAWLGDLVDAVAHEPRPVPSVASRPLPSALVAALEMIDDPLAAPLPVETAARRAGVTPEHLARLARRHLDTSLSELSDRRRHTMALRLLEETDQPIAAIAAQLCYRHAPSFHRAFLRWCGISPAAYRASLRARGGCPALGSTRAGHG